MDLYRRGVAAWQRVQLAGVKAWNDAAAMTESASKHYKVHPTRLLALASFGG